MTLERLLEPAAKPMDVSTARSQVRQDLPVDDADLEFWIRAAAKFAEHLCARTLIATRWVLTIDKFPCEPLQLDNGPILKIYRVRYRDADGVWTTLDSTVYALSGRTLWLAYDKSWPTLRGQLGDVQIEYDAGSAVAVTASAATDVLTIKGGIWKTLATDDVVRFNNSGGVLPRPLLPDTDYYARDVSGATFKVAATAGGDAIDITDSGTGTHYLGAVPEDVIAWMRLRIGSLYENRSDAIQAQGGQMLSLPYVDRLLDGARIWG